MWRKTNIDVQLLYCVLQRFKPTKWCCLRTHLLAANRCKGAVVLNDQVLSSSKTMEKQVYILCIWKYYIISSHQYITYIFDKDHSQHFAVKKWICHCSLTVMLTLFPNSFVLFFLYLNCLLVIWPTYPPILIFQWSDDITLYYLWCCQSYLSKTQRAMCYKLKHGVWNV